MRFVLDQDVDARVATTLRSHGHVAWTAGSAGLAQAADADLAAYACEHHAALLTHDVEFSAWRRKNVIGQHILLRCNEWDAPDVVKQHLDALVPMLERHPNLWVRLSLGVKPEYSHAWD